MKNANIIKLASGNVIYRDGNGFAKVITPPRGVDYDPRGGWNARHPHLEDGYWTGSYFSNSSEGGFLEAFEAAVNCREEQLNYLLSERLLPRMRKKYNVLENGNGYGVWDYFEQTTRYFNTRSEAEAYNEAVIQKYAEKFALTRDRMVTLAEFG